jgi:hypothetical protein
MSPTDLLAKARVEIKLGAYGVAPANALTDPSLLPRVQEYRRQASVRMVPLDPDDISKKIPTSEYHVSRKVDGEFNVLVYRDRQAFAVNPGGTVRIGLPWQDEAARMLADAKVQEAMVAGELYVQREDRRPRVHDVTTVARQPQSDDDLQRLRFAVFDLISLNGQTPGPPFADTWKTIQRIFGRGERVHPVEAQSAGDADGIARLFARWVEKEGAEGLVVRSDAAGQFKIKQRHTLDAVVIGFTESVAERQGLLHDLLLALVRPDGSLQVLSRVGGGFSEDQRRSLLSDLKDMVVGSEYAEVNADRVAYEMVRPEWVAEVSYLDLISETTRGGPVKRMVLEFQENGSSLYRALCPLPLASVISPQFIRLREDKTVHRDDVRIAQVSDRVEVALTDRDARKLTLPKSEVLHREVYTKQLKGETMIRKFVMWKTNKETLSDEFPAYVVHYTDFSPNRQSPLEREVRVSSSREQIEALCRGLKEENIKKGWELHSTFTATGQAAGAEEMPVAAVAARTGEPAAAATKPAVDAVQAEEAAATQTKAARPRMASSTRPPKKGRTKKTG